MEKYLVGSSLLGLSKARDLDYLIIGTKPSDYTYNEEDIRFREKNELLGCMKFENNSFGWIYNYQLDRQINNAFALYYSYNLLDYRAQLINRLKKVVNKKLFNFNKIITQGNKCCCKIIYHIAYNLFILENNSPIITEEQKVIIQKIHDLKMPIEYLDELEKRILLL